MRPVAVFGGYGTFGRLVCRELARRGLAVAVVGRHRRRCEELARTLGPEHEALVADARDPRACRQVVQGRPVAALCAGPFDTLGDALLQACLEEGCHYADIADDRAHAAKVRQWGPRFAARGLVAAYGCSSLPGLSGALARVAAEGIAVPRAARVFLFIGNDNPKGPGAVRSLVRSVGHRFMAPQGSLVVFQGRTVGAVPAPFGRRAFYPLETPEYDLFPELLGVRDVRVHVGFEWDLVNRSFALLARLPPFLRRGAGAVLASTASAAPRAGSSGGVVMAALSGDSVAGAAVDAPGRWAAAVARQDGQRMAALPCALVIEALVTAPESKPSRAGALAAYEIVAPRDLLRAVESAGFEVHLG